MMQKCFIALYFFMALSSCSVNSITNDDIDKFISRYNETSFSDFMNVSISYRDSDFGNDIYMIAKQGGSFPPYVVHFNKKKNEVTSIDNKLLNQINCKDYFSDNQIKDLMAKFISFNVLNLSVDTSGNLFISPFFGERSPSLLRLNVKTNEKVVRKGNIYELYKDRWYLNRTRKKE